MTYDMNILGDVTGVRPALAADGTYIRGLAKLAQRFLILLLSDNQEPDGIGTDLPRILKGRGAVDISVLENIFIIAAGDVKGILDASILDSDPDDEVLDRYAIEVGVTGPDTAGVHIILIARSGESLKMALPVDKLTTKED